MPMLETPIDKDDRTILAQHYIRMARQTWVVEPIAEPSAEKELPHHYLRLGIPPAYRSHTTMALLLGQFVHIYGWQRMTQRLLYLFYSYFFQIIVNAIIPFRLSCLIWWISVVSIWNDDYHALTSTG